MATTTEALFSGQARSQPAVGTLSSPALPSASGPSSGFRHLQGTVLPRSAHFTNLKGLNLTTPGESDGFSANRRRVAVPLLSAGGQVAVLEVKAGGGGQGFGKPGHCAPRGAEGALFSSTNAVTPPQLSKAGRLPDTSLPTIENGAPVSDLCWDPFDPEHLAIGR